MTANGSSGRCATRTAPCRMAGMTVLSRCLLAAAGALALLPAGAQATTFTRTTYDVRVQVAGSYHFVDDWDGGNGATYHREVKAEWDVDSLVHDYEFIDGIPTGRFEGLTDRSGVAGLSDETYETPPGGGAPITTDCKLTGMRPLSGPAITPKERLSAVQFYDVLVDQDLVVQEHCDAVGMDPYDYEIDLNDDTGTAQVGHFSAPSNMGPHYVANIAAADDAKCPHDRWDIDVCEIYWRGTIEFTRTGEHQVDQEGNPVD